MTCVGKEARVEVSDTGEGIAIEYRACSRTLVPRREVKDPSGEGKALAPGGTAIARGLVEAHGGTMDVESDLGRGSRFRLRCAAPDIWAEFETRRTVRSNSWSSWRGRIYYSTERCVRHSRLPRGNLPDYK